MRHRSDVEQHLRTIRCLLMAVCLFAVAFVSSACLCPSAYAQDQAESTRVMWQLRYDDGLSTAQREEIQHTLLNTLSRVKERHFATPSIVTSKIKNEGLQMPSCFENGGPCASGPSFLLDVHQVDIYVDALFSKTDDVWRVELKLFRRFSPSANTITQSGKNLSNLINNIVGSLFVVESSIDVTSTIPDVEIYLNQTCIGTTPLSMKITEGPQKLTFKKEGYFPETWEFTAKKGVIHTHDVVLKPETTQFTVLASDPDARIFIDGTDAGTTGEMREILPGEHHVLVKSEHYHDYEQSITVYPGNPQTMQVSMLPHSRDPYAIRHDGIPRYRFSATAGYHFAFQKFSMADQLVNIHDETGNNGIHVSPGGGRSGNQAEKWADTSFHGMTFALNYEDEYWGLTIARLDLMGSAIDQELGIYDQGDARLTKTFTANADGATFIGFYPAQIKGHYTFWVMQAEAVAGVGLSWLQLRTKIRSVAPGIENQADYAGYEGTKVTFSRTQFSANFDFALKYFFSEESFAMLSYGFQIDAEKHNEATFRHGMTFAVGLQIPLLMRDKKQEQSLEEGIMLDDNAPIGQGEDNAQAARVVEDGSIVEAPAPDMLDNVSGPASDGMPDPSSAEPDETPAVVEDADVMPLSAVFSVKEVFDV